MAGQHMSYFKDHTDEMHKRGIEFKDTSEKTIEFPLFTQKCKKISKEIIEIIGKWDPEEKVFDRNFFKSGGIKSKKTGNDFRNLLWWNVQLKEGCLEDKFVGYTNVLLSADRALIKDFENVHVGNNHSYPHIDDITGNIHVEFDIFDWLLSEETIRQAILAGPAAKGGKDPGPKWNAYNKTGKFGAKELIRYGENAGNIIEVPKVCYFPQLDSNDNEHYSIEKLLKNLLENLVKEEIRNYLTIR